MIGRVLAVAYVATVAGLTAYSFRSPDGEFDALRAVTGLITLPMLVPALPFIYVLGALAWSATDAADGGPMWPVTLTFTVIMTITASLNVVVLAHVTRGLRRSIRGRRAASGRTPSGA